eukprot:TRINITY_DN1338_c0_g1_i3.p1 TRINITY_DN1338_c0_g1~~TRINITY_DN1338_c0_g1_i3.p1  ORF type:complete len:116 (+),score=24.09 TRINITY_DN1338_c0_g1_i3:33-350(+)
MSLGRQLYKELIWTARDYPGGVDVIRRKAREHWLRNREVTDPDQLEKLYSHARFVIKELEALDRLKKYRFLKQNYADTALAHLDEYYLKNFAADPATRPDKPSSD